MLSGRSSVNMDSASELDSLHESDTSSMDGGPTGMTMSHNEELERRLNSVTQENKVLKLDLDTHRLRVKNLEAEVKKLRLASVTIQARAEQEEEFISNKLLKKINLLKKEKETLAKNYEHEEEFLTNELTKKLVKIQDEKVELERTLEKEQEFQVNKLMRKISRLEADMKSKQQNLEELRREKIDLENSLEQEQEALVNRLWKRMEKLEQEKRLLRSKLDGPVASPGSSMTSEDDSDDRVGNLTRRCDSLKGEVDGLRSTLHETRDKHVTDMQTMASAEKMVREENRRLRQQVDMEVERRAEICKHLSDAESTHEFEEERNFNELNRTAPLLESTSPWPVKPRTMSSPVPYSHPLQIRAQSPGAMSPACQTCGQSVTDSPPVILQSRSSQLLAEAGVATTPGRFAVPHSSSMPRVRSEGSTSSRSEHRLPPPSPKADS